MNYAHDVRFLPLAAMPGDVQALSTIVNEKEGFTKVVATANSTDKKEMGATKLIHFNLPHHLATGQRNEIYKIISVWDLIILQM